MLIASFIRDVACEMLADQTFHVPELSNNLRLDGVSAPTALEASLSEQTDLKDAQLAIEQALWPTQARSWRQIAAEDEVLGTLMPGMWMTPLEYGLLPRLSVLGGWNTDPAFSVPPLRPVCLSTRSKDPRYNLTPSANTGWEAWVHPEYLDKPYLVGRVVGARVSFEMETNFGVVKTYSLRSKTFGLGTVECWTDEERTRAVQVVGWWDNGEA